MGLLPEQGTGADVATQRAMASGFQSSQDGVANSSQASQCLSSEGVTQSTLSVNKVEGATETYPRQKITYRAELNKNLNEMSDEEKNKEVKWVAKVYDDEKIETVVTCKGIEKFTLNIKKDWEGKNILVIAYIENIEEAKCKTKVLKDSFKGTLIRGVEGEVEVALGQKEVEYRAINTNKDGDASKVNNGSNVKWAIKVGKDKRTTLEGKKGEKIILDIKKEWAEQEITVMPYLNSPTEIVSVKTKVLSLGSKVTEMLREIQINRTNQYAVFNCVLYIEKLINDMENHGMYIGWLRDVKESDIEIQIGNGLEGLGDETLGRTDIGTMSRNIFIKINLNNEYFKDKAGLNGEKLQDFDKQLYTILLHELVHAWQAKTGKASTNIEKRFGNRINRNGTQNIYIEVEAYNIQFEYEGKTGIKVKAGQVDRIREMFNSTYFTEEYKAEYLLNIFRNRIPRYEIPSLEELMENENTQ